MTDLTRGPVVGPDGKLRCPWGLSAPEYIRYHDEEWGRPVHGDQAIFERLCLEGFQSGLSWLTILRKRENFRAAFAGFDPEHDIVFVWHWHKGPAMDGMVQRIVAAVEQ